MSRRSAGPALALPIIMIIFLGGTITLFLPLNPSLTVTFTMGHATTYPAEPTVTVSAWLYSKVTLSSSAGVTKGEIVLSSASVATGQALYAVTVAVSYNDQLLSGPTSFGPLDEGTYQVHVIYFPRQEQASIPYVVTIVASQSGSPPVTITVNIIPT